MFTDKLTKSIAEAAKKCMDEELKGNQHKIDVNKNNKIDAEDFKHLRAGKKPVEEAMQKSDVPAYLRKQKGEKPLSVADVKGPRPDSISSKEALAKLRNEETVEELEQLDELSRKTLNSYMKKSKIKSDDLSHKIATTQSQRKTEKLIDKSSNIDAGRARARTRLKGSFEPKQVRYGAESVELSQGELEQIQEYESKNGVYKHQGTYGRAKDLEAGETDWDKEDKLAKGLSTAKKKPRKLGARQNFVRSTRVNEGFSAMLDAFEENGIKGLYEAWAKKKSMKEEASEEEFNAELKKQKDKAEGKAPQADVAKPAVQAVQNEEVEQVEERSMTEPEMKKREEIVKSMKKGIQGFKDRYGSDAKSVMYATATKQAMKEETESEHYKAGHEYASDHAQDSGFKVTARARKKEMLADNPHKKGTPEHADWHRGALDGHQTALDNM